eukprot:403138-Amphidinium_carterae.1
MSTVLRAKTIAGRWSAVHCMRQFNPEMNPDEYPWPEKEEELATSRNNDPEKCPQKCIKNDTF